LSTARIHILRRGDSLDSDRLKDVTAGLCDDGMVVDDQDATQIELRSVASPLNATTAIERLYRGPRGEKNS
jgi:hypothetical protein